MRKTRLVILPTKCLHQMGFLLLFLSCPVIGDWGRIQPESENSHNAIQIDREGTCGFERDPPGGLVDSLNESRSKQCRLSEDLDLNIFKKPIERVIQIIKSDKRRADVRRVDHQGNERMLERRAINERVARKMIQRMTDERRNARGVVQRNSRNDFRSRSVESRISSNRNRRTRSLSLSRLESERDVRITQRQNNERNLRRDSERLHLIRRSETQNERKTEQQRRLNQELSNERRENEKIRAASEGRERETRGTARLIPSVKRERQHVRREGNRRSIQKQSARRNDMTRRQIQEKTQNVGGRTERRLSLARREQNDATRAERFENRRGAQQINLERRLPEIRKIRLETEGRKSDQRRKLMRITKSFDNRQETENKRFAILSLKPSERNILERRVVLGRNERLEGMKSRKMTFGAIHRNQNDISQVNLSAEKSDEENLLEKVSKWMNLKSYDTYKTGDWTTNCVIGAVAYYLTTRQLKAV